MPTAIDTITLEFHATSPRRPTYWRWEYAREILETPAPKCPESGDSWVDRAVCHLSADKSAPFSVRSDKTLFDPRIEEAREIFSSEAEPRRWYLEALLLTPEPLKQVAKSCHLPLATVEAYAHLFFDVRPYLHATDWLLIHAVGCSPANRFAGLHPGGRWKYFALFGGIHVLDCYLAAAGHAPWPTWLPQAAGSDDPAVIERFKLKLGLTFRLQMAQSDEEVATLIELMEQLRTSNDRSVESSEQFRDLRKTEMFLASIPKLKRAAARRTKSKPRSTPHRDRTSTPPLPIIDPTKIIRKPK